MSLEEVVYRLWRCTPANGAAPSTFPAQGHTTTATTDFPGFRNGITVWDFACESCDHRLFGTLSGRTHGFAFGILLSEDSVYKGTVTCRGQHDVRDFQSFDRRSKQVEFVGEYGATGTLHRLTVSEPADLDRLVWSV